MSEWWTYSLHDFLLFAPRTYYRLIALYNADVWPAQAAGVIASLAVAWAALRRASASAGIAAFVLGAAWAWVAYGWLAQRYATINWAATYVAMAFAVEAALLVVAGVIVRSPDGVGGVARAPFASRLVGFAIIVLAVAYPVVAVVAGRGTGTSEVFGFMPAPTVLATLGVLTVRTAIPLRAWLLPIPLAWCAAEGATLCAMRSPEALLMPVAGLLAVVAVVVGRRGRDGVR